jgi:hypothetical protein
VPRLTRALGIGAAVLIAATSVGGVFASSHREAPLISTDPGADNTDLYAFVSPDRPDTVTIIANYIPLEEPAGGPNFAKFDPTVLYEIHVDNNGDARDDVTYQFRFKTTVTNKGTFLYNTGQITSLTDPDWNIRQSFSLTRIKGGVAATLGTGLKTPPVNIGPRSTPNYEALAAAAVNSLPGGIKAFAGERDDPFFVDLGSIFDLGGLRPFNNAHLLPMDPAAGVDGVGGFNTHSIAIQVPIAQLTRDGHTHPASDPRAVIGIYASAKRQQVRVLNTNGSTSSWGPWVQVSRLGNPLVNEVIIPVGKKDYWNSQKPAGDSQFETYYRNPELAALVNLLYPTLPDAPTSGRTDLDAVLLTGVPTLNFTGPRLADLLRLNTGIAPSATVGNGNRLGVLAGDFAGFPNGRRLEDDVTDIEIRAVACGYGDILAGALGLCNLSPNNAIGDGVNENDMPFLTTFPYVSTPHQGYEHTHHRVGPTPL